MTKINVRYGSKSEIDQDKFQLFTDENEGDTIVIAETENGVVGFAQLLGEEIGFIESNEKGAGKAMVEFLKADYDHLVADRTDDISQGFWKKMGFEACGFQKFDWYAE